MTSWLQTFRDYSYSIILLFMDQFQYFFFDLEIWWGFQIRYCTFPKWLSGPQKSNFLVYEPIWIIFFSLTLKFDGDSKSDIVPSLKCLTGPQKSWYLELRLYECCHSCFCIIFHSLAFRFFPKRFANYGYCHLCYIYGWCVIFI